MKFNPEIFNFDFTLSPGRYYTSLGFDDFIQKALEFNSIKLGAYYNWSGPSRVLYAYSPTRTYSLRVFTDGGFNWFEVQDIK